MHFLPSSSNSLLKYFILEVTVELVSVCMVKMSMRDDVFPGCAALSGGGGGGGISVERLLGHFLG